MVAMPQSVKVGCHTYTVARKSKTEMKGSSGECDYDALTISVRKGLRKTMAQETLLHEVLHACVDPNLREGEHKEEDYINSMSDDLLLVLKENPELIQYLTQ